MKTLLIHALNPEAGLVKQHFPKAFKKISEPGMELLELNSRFDILRTGIGLRRTEAALEHISDSGYYGRAIQFGVSGSLTDELPVRSLIKANQFSALDHPTIKLERVNHLTLPVFKTVNFYSSLEVVIDEASRAVAIAHDAQAVDMESYAVAQFCQAHKLPFLALRIISDRAGESTPEQFRQHFKVASKQLQNILLDHILKPKAV